MTKRKPGEPFALSSPFVDQQQMLLISQIEAFYWRVMQRTSNAPLFRKGNTGSITWTMFPDATEGKIMVSYGLPWHKEGFHQDSFEVPLTKVLMGLEEDIQALSEYLQRKD